MDAAQTPPSEVPATAPLAEPSDLAPNVTEAAPADPVAVGDLVAVEAEPEPDPAAPAELAALPPETPEPPPVAPAADVVSDAVPEEPTAPAAVPLAEPHPAVRTFRVDTVPGTAWLSRFVDGQLERRTGHVSTDAAEREGARWLASA